MRIRKKKSGIKGKQEEEGALLGRNAQGGAECIPVPSAPLPLSVGPRSAMPAALPPLCVEESLGKFALGPRSDKVIAWKCRVLPAAPRSSARRSPSVSLCLDSVRGSIAGARPVRKGKRNDDANSFTSSLWQDRLWARGQPPSPPPPSRTRRHSANTPSPPVTALSLCDPPDPATRSALLPPFNLFLMKS